MISPMQLAMQLLSRNPNVVNNPLYRNYIDVIQSGRTTEGEQIARNLCQTYGVSPEQAYAMARQYFGMM